jgi:2-dehydro-3-deoxyphosphooctonate aldolase (KDO 8-P synthase)
MKNVSIKNYVIDKKRPLTIFCGPCAIESRDHALHAAEFLKKLFDKLQLNLVFKSSYDKANRSSIHSFRGVGIDAGLEILHEIQKTFDLPVVTDVHTPEEAHQAGQICEVLQIPAFLCRQTDLIVAAGKTGKVISVKKGQFMAPGDMGNAVEKIKATGNPNVILVERGTTFGYNNLVCDMRGIPIMQKFGVPVCFDATHSVQLPGGNGTTSGGQREYIPTLAKAAIAAGVDCLFMEAHPDPEHAKSDKDSVIPFADLPKLLEQFKRLYEVVNGADA